MSEQSRRSVRIKEEAAPKRAASSNKPRHRPTLPRPFERSTIGAGGLNFRVRNGTGCDPAAMGTETSYSVVFDLLLGTDFSLTTNKERRHLRTKPSAY